MIEPRAYRQAVRQRLAHSTSFTLTRHHLLQGFPQDETLQYLREQLRSIFQQSAKAKAKLLHYPNSCSCAGSGRQLSAIGEYSW
jgi:hypothetical protein